jgi:hypothetical protein
VALCRSVLKEDNILCELYAYTCSDVSDNSESEILDSDNDIPATSSHKQLRPAIVFTGHSETSTEEEEKSEPESSNDKTSDV